MKRGRGYNILVIPVRYYVTKLPIVYAVTRKSASNALYYFNNKMQS